MPKKGTHISFGDELIHLKSSELKTYPVAAALSIKPDAIFNYLSVVVGQTVEPGTVLAEKKSFVGKKTAQSDVTGVVDRIEYELGNITVRFGSSSPVGVISAFFEGILENVDGEKSLYTVSFAQGHQFEFKKVSQNAGGELCTFDEKNFFTITADEVAGRIALLENPQVHLLSKLEALDAAGCISGDNVPPTALPVAVFLHKKDAAELTSLKKHLFVFSEYEKKGVAYS